MSTITKFAALLLVFGVAACSQPEPEPAPEPMVEPEPVFTGKA